jgi:hypothetical protein
MEIFLWTHPRSVSTAFERIIAERGDFKIFHEPFSDLYYNFDKKATAVGYNTRYDFAPSYTNIKKYLQKQFKTNQQSFIKDMVYHCWDYIDEDYSWLLDSKAVFLFRNPEASIASHYAMNKNLTCDEVGYDKLWELYQKLTESGKNPLLIESELLTENPEIVLAQFEQHCNLASKKEALNWKKEAPKEWNTWSEWHKDATESKGIQKKQKKYEHTIHNNKKLKAYWDFHMPYYEKLLNAAKAQFS